MEKTREKQIIKTSIIGIIANFFLVGFKAFVGFMANSISIIMDAVNNFTDSLSSIITIVGTKLSNKKPNKNHPYGYGRIEYISSMLIAGLIIYAAISAIVESIKSIINHFQTGDMPQFEIYSIIIIALAIVVKVVIGLYFKKKGQAIDSESLIASGNDALFDAILSTATLVGMIIAKFVGIYVEGYLGIVIGIFIFRTGMETLLSSLSSIIGHRYEKEYIENMKEDILKIDHVLGAYDLILHSYGHNKNIGSVHIGVDEKLTAKDIQYIERQIFNIMYHKYHAIMTVGVYAENITDEYVKTKYQQVADLTIHHETILQTHGFYYDEENKKIYFDLVISFDEADPEGLIEHIQKEVEDENPGFTVIINYDQDFSVS